MVKDHSVSVYSDGLFVRRDKDLLPYKPPRLLQSHFALFSFCCFVHRSPVLLEWVRWISNFQLLLEVLMSRGVQTC